MPLPLITRGYYNRCKVMEIGTAEAKLSIGGIVAEDDFPFQNSRSALSAGARLWTGVPSNGCFSKEARFALIP
jgi:hypothetical protein